MSFKLSIPRPLINNPNISKIWITANDDGPLFLETQKCFSYGVRKDEKINSLSMSLILDESTKQKIQEFIIVTNIESSNIFYGKSQDTIYVKLTPDTTFYDIDDNEVNPLKFENKKFITNAILKLESITQSNDKNNLQIKPHDAVVKEPEKRKHFRKVVNKLLLKILLKILQTYE